MVYVDIYVDISRPGNKPTCDKNILKIRRLI